MANTKTRRRRQYRRMIARRALCIEAILVAAIVLVALSCKNAAEEVFIDTTIPEIVLRGKTTTTILIGDAYRDPGYSAIDNGQDLTNRIIVESDLDEKKPGNYTIKYSVTDDYGNFATASRKIIVEDDYTFKTKDIDFYIRSLENYLKTKNYDLSIGYQNLNSNYIYKYNPEKSYYGASTIKSIAALYAYENMELTSSLKSLIKPMISVSSNEAYESVASQIGLKNLKTYGENLGLTNFMTDRSNTYYSDTTVDNQIIAWQKLWEFFNENEKGEELKSYFDNDNYNYLKFDNSQKVLHKYGSWGNVFHDTGIFENDSPYIVVILTNHGGDNYEKIIKDVSEKIYGLNELVKNL